MLGLPKKDIKLLTDLSRAVGQLGDFKMAGDHTDIKAIMKDFPGFKKNFLRIEFYLDTAARAGATGGTELNFYYFGEANKVMYRGHLISEIDDPTLASHFSTATILAA